MVEVLVFGGVWDLDCRGLDTMFVGKQVQVLECRSLLYLPVFGFSINVWMLCYILFFICRIHCSYLWKSKEGRDQPKAVLDLFIWMRAIWKVVEDCLSIQTRKITCREKLIVWL